MGNAPSDKWQPDAEVNSCACCNQQFNLIQLRKHHCRSCGSVVCYNCSQKIAPIEGFDQNQRVCDKCASEVNGIDIKPNMVSIWASKWSSPWIIALTDEEIDKLPDSLRASTKEMRTILGGRKAVVYPIPVGAYSVTASKSWKPRPTDIIITTFHKTGTTWCQQICHQIRTRGHIDFKEITEVIPWIDFAWEINQNLNDDQIALPRLYKSHARLSALHEGCKYLTTIRDPINTLKSLYHFFIKKNMPFPKWFLSDLDNFAKCPVWAIDSIWGGNYWEYMADFYLCRNLPNVKVLCFEDMLTDLDKMIPELCSFMNVECDDELISIVLNHSSKKWMLEHDELFNEGWFYEEQLKYKRYDTPPLKPVSKVNNHTPQTSSSSTTTTDGGGEGSGGGGGIELLDSTIEWMQSQWEYYVLPRTGCKNYDEMRANLLMSQNK